MAAPAYRSRLDPGRRRVTISTGRNAATPLGNTIPWMLQGMPSRNGITRARSQRSARNRAASAASSSPRTQRRSCAPPLNPWRASPAQAVPAPRSSRPAAARRASGSAVTTADGALVTPRSSQSWSTTTLSSSRRHSGRRGP